MRITRMDANDASWRDGFVEQELSYRIVNAFFEVYNALGYGLLESLYVAALVVALEERGLKVEREAATQLLTASRCRLGLLLHFGPTPQFHRILNRNA